MFKELNQTNTSDFFTTMYFAPTITYPAYYPAWALEKYPDALYPGVREDRIGGNQGAKYNNPYSYLSNPDYRETMTNRLMTDIDLIQKLYRRADGGAAN